MTRDRLPLAASVVALGLAVALSGCATTGSSDRTPSETSSTDADAIKHTRVVSTESVSPPAAGAVPLRSPARVMRIWIAPWEDSRGDLHAPGYLYTEIEPRRWTLGASAQRGRETRIRPLQIERPDVPARNARSGRGTDATRTPGRPKPAETGPNLLGS